MTNATTPIQAAFEMQRQSIKQSQRLFEQGLEIQQNATEAFLRNGLAAQRSAQEQGAEFARELTNAQFDSFESAVDESESELRGAIDEQVERNAQLTREVLDAQFEQAVDLFQQVLDAQFDAVQSALDDDQFDVRSAVDEQFEAFADSQNEAWDDLEAEFLEAVDELTERQRALFAQSVEAYLDAQRDAERQTVEGVQQTEDAVETAQQQGEDVAQAAQESVEEVAAETAQAAQQQAHAVDESLEDIAGLGSTYADRLRDEGIESVTHLAQANVETVAAAADASREEAEEWVQAAESQA